MRTKSPEATPMETLRIESIGHLRSTLQQPFHKIRKAAEALSIEPAAIINGIVHFSEPQIDAIAEHLASKSKTLKGNP